MTTSTTQTKGQLAAGVAHNQQVARSGRTFGEQGSGSIAEWRPACRNDLPLTEERGKLAGRAGRRDVDDVDWHVCPGLDQTVRPERSSDLP